MRCSGTAPIRCASASAKIFTATTLSRRSAAPGRTIDLTRQLKNTVIVSYGRDFATANTEFQRVGSTMTGRQSHVWLRTDKGWRIAAAHVSLMPAPARDTKHEIANASAPAP